MSRPPSLSPREARDRWLDKRRVDSREQSISTYYYRLKLFTEWCDSEGIEEIGDLSGWDIESFEAHRRGQGVSASTLNNEMGTLKNFLEYCARVDLVDESLPDKVDVPDVPKEEASSEKKLTADAATALLQYYRNSPEQYGTRGHTLLELAWYTGARIGALRGLDVRDYDPDAEYVVFKHRIETGTQLKRGLDGERPVSLPSDVCDVLDAYDAHHRIDIHDAEGRKPFLASQRGRPATGTMRDWTYLATIPCHHSECPHDRNPATCEYTSYNHASKCPSSRSPHQVRTGAITWMLNRGLPYEVVAERVNSSAETIKKHYDKEEPLEEMEQRRRPFLERLSLGEATSDEDSQS